MRGGLTLVPTIELSDNEGDFLPDANSASASEDELEQLKAPETEPEADSGKKASKKKQKLAEKKKAKGKAVDISKGFNFELPEDDDDVKVTKKFSAAHYLKESGLAKTSARDMVSIDNIIQKQVDSQKEELSNIAASLGNVEDQTTSETHSKALKHLNEDGTAAVEAEEPVKEYTFEELNLSRPLLRAIADMNFVKPTPVQVATIPNALSGADLLVSAVTGSGKTASFVLPILERLMFRDRRVPLSRVVILCPTRELAAQCFEVVNTLASKTDVKAVLVVGGLSEQVQATALRQRPDIIVATPGRILDHLLNTVSVHLEDVEILVLDEADRLLEMGFADEVKEIVKQCPKSRQTLMFSATITEQVEELAKVSLNRPKRIAVDPLFSLAHSLSQEFIRIRAQHDTEESRTAIVMALCIRTFKTKTIVFFPTRRLAHKMKIVFGLLNLKAAELHGDLTQLQRMEALDQFKDGLVDFLLCTDLASRGLDIKGVSTVINYDFPKKIESYVHRVGRTARAGKGGLAVTLLGDGNHQKLAQILKKAPESVKRRRIPPNVIDEMSLKIKEMAESIDAVLREEKVERTTRIAEMEMNKTKNMMIHEEEIMNRPAKVWFQSEKEKKNVKTKSKEEAKGEDETKQEEESMSESEKHAIKVQQFQKRVLKRKKRAKIMGDSDAESDDHHGPIRRPKKRSKHEAFDHDDEDTPLKMRRKNKKPTGGFKSKKRYARR